MVMLSAIGGGWGMLALAPLLFVARARAFAAAAALTLGASALVVFVTKAIVGRPRPCACVPGIEALGFRAPTDGSFPSGHAAGSFAFALFFSTWMLSRSPRSAFARGTSALAIALAFGVAASRVVLGVHFPSDVAAGAALGGVMGWAGARRSLKRLQSTDLGDGDASR
jgi:undecaprenyl-diphosphatase